MIQAAEGRKLGGGSSFGWLRAVAAVEDAIANTAAMINRNGRLIDR